MRKKALVVVLGELSRSPRMQYHCLSLADNQYEVGVIANGGADKCREELESHQHIRQHLMPNNVDFKKYLPSATLAYILKPIWQSFVLIYYLCSLGFIPNVIVVQNPPSIPTLPILWLYSLLTGSKLIIDWHNYGFSILGLNLKPEHPFVRASKAIEFYFGRRASAGFCVSEAMRIDLVDNYHINYPIHVLYDRPPKHFKPLNLREKHNFYLKMKHQIPAFKSVEDKIEQQQQHGSTKPPQIRATRFTVTDAFDKNIIKLQPNRPAIIMSSTSWTEDEDFGLLLETLKRYDVTMSNQLSTVEEESDFEEFTHLPRLPQLVCVITGKGPLKAHYESQIEQCKFQHVEVVLPWLTAADYAKMVGSCDLGISLHNSSSGTDLPMKVVDMFGCGIPVLAYHYEAINELVIDDFYGLTFKDSDDLYNKLILLLTQFYEEDFCSRDEVEGSQLGRYRKNIKRRFLLSRWEDNWRREAKPLLDKVTSKRK